MKPWGLALTGSLLLTGMLLMALAQLVTSGPQSSLTSKPVPIELAEPSIVGTASVASRQTAPAGVAVEQARRLLSPIAESKPASRRSVSPPAKLSTSREMAVPAWTPAVPSTPVAASRASPTPEGSGVQHPLYRPLPEYPQRARLMRRQGTVKIRYVVGTDGRLQQLRLLEGDPELARAAFVALRQWRYSKRLTDTAPTEEIKTLTLIFRLGGGGQVTVSE